MTEQDGLAAIKARMSEKQRREMAEIVQNEMRRRGLSNDTSEAARSAPAPKKREGNGLSRDQVGELYTDLSSAVKKMREKKLDQEIKQVRRMAGKEEKKGWFKMPDINLSKFAAKSTSEEDLERGAQWPKIAMLVCVLGIGGLKIYYGAVEPQGISSNPVDSEEMGRAALSMPTGATAAVQEVDVERMATFDSAKSASMINGAAPNERQLLLELDARRVELEQRREALDRREADLKSQQQAMAERLAELRTMTAKLSDAHKEKNTQYEARLGQLANVYGAMGPNEAAVLISRLEDNTAIDLLQRMPEKRMGQILSFMDKERAVELTRILTDKSSVR